MRARLTGLMAVVALAGAAAPAAAQLPTITPTPTPSPSPSATPSPSPSPSPTPTPTPTPSPEEQEREERDRRDRRSSEVRAIYRDFQRDGRIDDCDHTRRALKRARRSISDSYERDRPDFRDALSAAIQRHDNGRCVEEEPPTDADPDTTPAPGGGTTPAPPAPAPAPAPAPPPPPPAPAPDSGALPDFGGGGGGGSGGGGSGGVTPLPGEDAIPEGTPAPPAATPAPPPPPSRLAVVRAATDPNLLVPGAMLAIALLGLLFAALSALAAKRGGRLAGVGHAWREAAWRTSGTWNDFTDWLRTGR